MRRGSLSMWLVTNLCLFPTIGICVVMIMCFFGTGAQTVWALTDKDAEVSDHYNRSPKMADTSTSTVLGLEAMQSQFRYPQPVSIRVGLFQSCPVIGARVIASITSPSGITLQTPLSEALLDTGTVPMSGTYIAILSDIEQDGRYIVRIRADDNGGKASCSGSVQSAPTTIDHPNAVGRGVPVSRPKPFSVERVTYVDVTGYEGNLSVPPHRINSLYGKIERSSCVRLHWQVPVNIGAEGEYEARASGTPITSKELFFQAKVLGGGAYTATAGQTQTFASCELGSGRFFVAVLSRTSAGVESDVSNDYSFVLP